MKKQFTKGISMLLLSAMLLGVVAWGGAAEAAAASGDGPITLRLVTEKTVHDGMNAEVERLVDAFEKERPGFTIQVDILPTEEEERKEYIEAIKKQIEEGKGPDLFLLPTSSTLTLDEPKRYTYQSVLPLFPYVENAMEKGVFMDLHSLYDSDAELEKDKLKQEIMDAGTVGEARYVLPLRYTMPVFYALDEELAGVDKKALESGIDEWMKEVIKTQSPELACGAEYSSFNAFSDFLDYKSGKVTLDPGKAEAYLEGYRQIKTLVGKETHQRSSATLSSYIAGTWKQFPVKIDYLEKALVYSTIARREGKNLSMYPVRSVEGDVIANVTYYGAVGSNCEHPEEAYAFLRQFLMEDSQWERFRPQQEQKEGLMEAGWPVLVRGSVASLWDILRVQNFGTHFSGIDFQNEDIPILAEKIQQVRLQSGFGNSFLFVDQELNDGKNEKKPTDADTDALAKKLIDTVQQTYDKLT